MRLKLEQLEDRTLLSNFTAASVSDLIADITAANLAGGSNTITLVAGRGFQLSAVDNTTDGANGLPVIAAGDDLTIVGNGDTIARSTAAGTPAFRLFDVADGAILTLQNVTLQGGLASGAGVEAEGGAIFNQGTLTMNGVTVQGNTALGINGNNGSSFGGRGSDGGNAFGGGLYVAGGSVALNGGTFSTNLAQGGAGGMGGNGRNAFIPRPSRPPFGCRIRCPRPIPAGNGGAGGAGGGGFGGGLFVAGGAVTMNGLTISSNAARGGTGGVGGAGGHGIAGRTDYLGRDGAPGPAGPAGLAQGGGLYSANLASIALDAFTQAHVANNNGGNIFEPSTIAVSGFPSPTTAGYPGSFTVEVRDATGARVTQYNGTVHFTSGDSQADLPDDYTFSAADRGIHTFNAMLNTAGTQSLTATEALAPILTATQTDIMVSAAPASFLVSAPASVTAGSMFSVTVTALDAAGSTFTGYIGSMRLTNSDPMIAFNPTHTFSAADAGVFSFDAWQYSAGTQTITATDVFLPGVTGVATTTVNPAAAVSFLVSAPAASTAGTTVGVTVTASDPWGNTDTGYAGTVHFTSGDPRAGLPDDYTFADADQGVHTFSAILNTNGYQTITATDTVTDSLTGSAYIVVNPVAFVVSVSDPGNGNPGATVSYTVTAVDPNNNPVSDYLGTVHFTSNDSRAILPDDYSFTAADQGMHTFSAVLNTSGYQAITATDTVTASLTGTTYFAINPVAFLVSVPDNSTASASFDFTVTAVDPTDNAVSGYSGTVHFTSSDSQASLPRDYTFTAADHGVHTFSAILKTARYEDLTATDTLAAGVTGAEDIFVNPAAANRLVVTAPDSVAARVPFFVTVTPMDRFNNIATGYAGTVRFTSSDRRAALPRNWNFAFSAAAGQTSVDFIVTLKTAGTQAITATDTITASINGAHELAVSRHRPVSPRRGSRT